MMPLHNPVFASSLKMRMRSFRTPLLITLYGAFLLLVSFSPISVLQSERFTLLSMRAGIDGYIMASAMQFVLIVLVAPALTAGSIAGERERQTLDLLLCTRTGSLSIALGKLLSGVSFLALLIVSALPAMCLVLLFGGISLVQMLTMLLFLLVTAVCASGIGLVCSAMFKRTVTATVVSYLMIFALGIGTLLLALWQAALYEDLYRDVMYNAVGTVVEDAIKIPFLIYVNPAIGLCSLLVTQTGLLETTLSGFFSGWIFDLLTVSETVSFISMAFMAGLTVVLVFVSAALIRPKNPRTIRKEKK